MVSHLRVPLGHHTQMCTYGYTKDKVSERGEREESAGGGGRTSWPFPQWHSTNWVVATENIVIKFEWRHEHKTSSGKETSNHITRWDNPVGNTETLQRDPRPRDKCDFTRERLMMLSRSNHSRPWRSLCRVFALAQASAYNVCVCAPRPAGVSNPDHSKLRTEQVW